jgi:hypothetical protein
LSEGQRQLARRATTISIACERLEGEAAAGTPIDLECYGQLTDRLGRCFQRLGLKRVPRDVQTLDEYLASKAQAAREADAAQSPGEEALDENEHDLAAEGRA